MTLGYPTSGTVLELLGQRSRLGYMLTAIQHGFELGFPKPDSICKTGFSVLRKAKTGFRFRSWKSHNCVHCKSAGRGVEVKDGADPRTVCSAGNVQVATDDRGVRC